MGLSEDQLALVQMAMDGQTEAFRQLVESIHDPLRTYVYRITLNDDFADDIVQETILEMFKIFHQLRQADSFWPWLCKVALNKTRQQARSESRQKRLLKEHAGQLAAAPSRTEALAGTIHDEFKQSILKAISSLSDRQKAVLSMRCYEKMPYTQIAEIMDISELGCRLLFLRAKKKLRNRLFRLGYGKGALITALILFGKITAPSEAAAAQISITSATLSVGGLAAGIGLVTSKAALTVAAGGVVAAGTWTVAHTVARPDTAGDPSMTQTPMTISDAQPAQLSEGYYFFPQGKQGPVMTRLTVTDADKTITQVLQNNSGNYTYSPHRQSVTLDNYRYWKSDLSVMTLPTDSPELEAFLASIEHRPVNARPVAGDAKNLLFVSNYDDNGDKISFGVRNYDALMEERFQFNRPADAAVIDRRDELHRQGGCRVSITGRINGRTIDGSGFIPFVYGTMMRQPAWLELRIDRDGRLLDTASGAAWLDGSGKVLAAYPAGTFMTGLNRPWQGLHALDSVRRDAAAYRMPFETELASKDAALVTVASAAGRIVYTINMQKDWIERIEFFDSGNISLGSLLFSYDSVPSSGLSTPRLPAASSVQKPFENHWLSELATGHLKP